MEKIFVIHGVDHKVGTTMLSQSIAQTISNSYPSKRILLLFLNGRKSTEYIKEETGSIENIKIRLDNLMIDGSEIESFSLRRGNLFILAGIGKMEEERLYMPENVDYLLSEIKNNFDLIIIDSGSNLDNGLAIGALRYSENRILVITQQETALKRYEELMPTYSLLGFEFKKLLINKYFIEDPYDREYITKRLKKDKNSVHFVKQNNNYRLAEATNKSLLEFKDDIYLKDILEISNWILQVAGLDKINKLKRINKWINFI
jgi:cellulose biosynthesis protein BcsQ